MIPIFSASFAITPQMEALFASVYQRMAGPRSIAQLAADMDLNESNVRDMMRQLAKEGLVEKRGVGPMGDRGGSAPALWVKITVDANASAA